MKKVWLALAGMILAFSASAAQIHRRQAVHHP